MTQSDDPSELRFLVETYYDLQQMRIEATNRLGAAERSGGDPARLKRLGDWIDERLGKQERELKAMVMARIRNHPLWQQWLKDVKGVGPCIAGGLIAWIRDIGRFDTVSKLWAYFGLHVVNGEAARRRKGEKANWSASLKVLAWKAATSFVRVGEGYRELYERRKVAERERHPEPEPYDPPRKKKDGSPLLRYTDGHIDNRARRWVVKVFLSHVWQRWREIEGLPTRPVYPIEYQEHTTPIPVVEK